MNSKTREIQYFFFSQYFSDGLRITLGVLLPTLVLAQFNLLKIGLALSVGAFGCSITDSPGPELHRRNGILSCCFFIFLVALITGLARTNDLLMGLVILFFSFFFSMFTVYGNRAASVGTASLLVMVLSMNRQFGPVTPLLTAFLVLGGGLWYLLLGMLFSQIIPYRPAQQALGECIHEVAKFLRLKAAFYSPGTNLEEDYRQLVAQQVLVSEKQDAVRELLFKSRQIVKEFTNTGRTLVLTFVDVVDLYEQIMTIHYDYASLRERFGKTGILDKITVLITQIAEELDAIGLAIQSNTRYTPEHDLMAGLEHVKRAIDRLEQDTHEGSNLALRKILVNMRNLVQRLHDLQNNYTSKGAATQSSNKLELSRFVSHQDFNPKVFRNNLTFKSAAFRHALRVSLAAIIGFSVARLMEYGHHGYWIILTIIFILKPAFSLTRQRNYQRLIGTLIGGVIGILIMLFVQDMRVQFVLLVLFMLGTYSFIRFNYILMVICVTPLVFILFNFLGSGSLALVQERVIDTLIGCAIAFAASYLFFPSWESTQLNRYMQDVARANRDYLALVLDSLSGKKFEMQEYKLIRKQVYVHAANLSAAFQRMASEPKSKQKNSKEVYEYVVLNHILSSYIATVASPLVEKEPMIYPLEYQRPLKRSVSALNEALKKLDTAIPASAAETCAGENNSGEQPEGNPDELLLKEQLRYIQKVSYDICKATEAVV
jgi:YccS/YhfK family integral membrane protein